MTSRPNIHTGTTTTFRFLSWFILLDSVLLRVLHPMMGIPIGSGGIIFLMVEASMECHLDGCSDSTDFVTTTSYYHGDAATSATTSSVTPRMNHHPHRQQYPHHRTSTVPEDCGLVMASSPIDGWGVFTLKPRQKGEAILYGDAIVQLIDLPDNTEHVHHVQRLLHQYWWSAEVTGGFYEARHVVSSIAGMGMLANGNITGNLLPWQPRVDEGGLTRMESPGAGAITHYYNYTWHVQRPLAPGQELLINYGPHWFQERKHYLPMQSPMEIPTNNNTEMRSSSTVIRTSSSPTSNNNNNNTAYRSALSTPARTYSVEWLRENGHCLDTYLELGLSQIPHAGRGVRAKRGIPQGSIVLPVPVLAITDRRALEVMVKSSSSKSRSTSSSTTSSKSSRTKYQLLLNYCLGHPQSSLLFYPYGPGMAYINHPAVGGGGGMMMGHDDVDSSAALANVRLEWSTPAEAERAHNITLEELRECQQRPYHHHHSTTTTRTTTKFLFHLVATRDIAQGEEILMDYGKEWVKAWKRHVQDWKPVGMEESDAITTKRNEPYAPSYVMDDVLQRLRTPEELRQFPYPKNIMTSCFYRYSDHVSSSSSSSSSSTTSETVTTVPWTRTRGIFSLSNLRPCTIVRRFDDEGDLRGEAGVGMMTGSHSYYTVQIKNRPGLVSEERIPPDTIHIVTHVPRSAIRTTDQYYRTDQHLPNAFRHSIGLPDELVPHHWKDRMPTKEEEDEYTHEQPPSPRQQWHGSKDAIQEEL